MLTRKLWSIIFIQFYTTIKQCQKVSPKKTQREEHVGPGSTSWHTVSETCHTARPDILWGAVCHENHKLTGRSMYWYVMRNTWLAGQAHLELSYSGRQVKMRQFFAEWDITLGESVIRLPHSILPLPHRRSPAVGSWRPTATGLAVLSKENLEERPLPTSAWGLQQVLTILRKVLLWCHFIQGNRGLERVQNFLRDTAEKLENFPDSDSRILNHSAFNCISIYLYLSILSIHTQIHAYT